MESLLKIKDLEKMVFTQSVLKKKYKDHHTVEDLAKNVGMHVTKFKYCFKHVFQTTPMEFLARIRIEKAKTLLEQTDLPIHIVSNEVGYASTGSFINRFKRVTGILPLKWRRISRQKLCCMAI